MLLLKSSCNVNNGDVKLYLIFSHGIIYKCESDLFKSYYIKLSLWNSLSFYVC